jgi:hypothetical protein
MTREEILNAEPEKLNELIVSEIFEWDFIYLDQGLGNPNLFAWDKSAIKCNEYSTSCSLAGGQWEKGKDKNGNIIEVFAKYAPQWSKFIGEAYQLEEKIKENGLSSLYTIELLSIIGIPNILDPDEIFNLIHATPEQRCKAALLTILESE